MSNINSNDQVNADPFATRDGGIEAAFRNNGSMTPFRTVELTQRVVTYQQLNNHDFYELVKGPLLLGQVDVIDQRCDQVLVGGDAVGFDDPRAAVALAQAQSSWVGVNPGAPEIYTTLGVDWWQQQAQRTAEAGS